MLSASSAIFFSCKLSDSNIASCALSFFTSLFNLYIVLIPINLYMSSYSSNVDTNFLFSTKGLSLFGVFQFG